ncbi:hypothetical protein ACFVKB_49125, partial [Rhodococcus sp. NPDC127530]|uniref:hypothetical protein n=1 Tax=Rhodococcus sp. NPDC127530 TaxID=3345397 RepID=UPI0036401196
MPWLKFISLPQLADNEHPPLVHHDPTELCRSVSVVSGWSWCLPFSCRRVLLLGLPPVESGVPLDVGCVRGGHIGPAATEKWK